MEMSKKQGQRSDLIQDKHQKCGVLYKLLIEQKKSYREAADILCVNHKTIMKWSRIHSIKSNHRGAWPVVARKNNLNDDYFEKIDSWQKAYLIGLLITDGNVRKHSHSYKIALSLVDKDALEFFAKEMDYTGSIKGKDFYRLEFVSEKMFHDLGKLEITPRKTFTVKMPKIKKEFFYDFLRGVIDGDGCYSSGGISICSASHIFLSAILERVNKDFPEGYIHKLKTGRASVLYFRKKLSIKVIQKMFKDNKFAIKRKKEKALMFAKMKA